MAITRKLVEVKLNFDEAGAVTITAFAIVSDDAEGTSTGAQKIFKGPQITAAAEALRDQVIQQFGNQGKPVTF